MTTTGGSEVVLEPGVSDGVSNLVFGNATDKLLVASWDKFVRLYDGRKNEFLGKFEQKSAVLDCAFSDDDLKGFAGGVDKTVTMIDFSSSKTTLLGAHEKSVKCVNYNAAINAVITGSWDSCVSIWDPRTSKSVGTYPHKSKCKVFTMDTNGNRLVVGYNQRQVQIFDVRQMATEQVRESSLMNQTRCIRCSPDGEGYALSSIEGRVAIEYFDPSPKVQKKKYAFKCHRKTVGKTQTLFPVNAIAYHRTYGTFATGGCDGFVNVWDGNSKKRICQYQPYATSIAALSFNADGSLLAVASSYTFEEGEKDHPADTIHVRQVNDHEVRPKTLATKT